MPLLTGTIADVSGDTIDAEDVFEVYLKAPHNRLSGADIDSLVTTSPVNLVVGSGGTIEAEVDPGPAVLVIRTFRSLDTFNMIVTGDATTFRDAIVAEIGALPELEQSQLIQLANQVRQDALAAQGYVQDAKDWAESFELEVSSTSTGASGSSASVTVTGEGPSYGLSFTIPKGDQGIEGPQGPPGEVTEAMLDSAVAGLVGSAPEALDTLQELADALGGDPNFATTVATQIGERAKTVDVDAALSDKANASQLGGKTIVVVSELPGSPDANTIYLIEEA